MSTPHQQSAAMLVGADISDFLASLGKVGQQPDAVAIFHGVRRLPYHSSGDRSLSGILKSRKGSCSSKHLLLAALLNRVGVQAQVELVQGDFATPLRTAHGVPASFSEAAKSGVRDIHNVVRAWLDGRPTVLDATWHDDVKPYGFRVNDAWQGEGDTEIAVDVESFLGPATDAAAAKAQIIASWPAREQARRRAFLEQINEWVAGLSAARLQKN